MDSVGLVLDVDRPNALFVRAIATTAAPLTKQNILPGDTIVVIEGQRKTSWTLVDASIALSGAVGETKQLIVDRNGQG